MANLKIGMRVKKVANCPWRNDIPLGAQGTIVGISKFAPVPGGMDWLLLWDGISKNPADVYNAADFMLAPLTDPRAEEFIGDMERFAKVAQKRPVGVA